MLKNSLLLPPALRVDDPSVAGFLGNAMIEGFATHARVTIEFFNLNRTHKDDVRAAEFTVSGTYSPGFVRYDEIRELTQKINKQVAHLTKNRVSDEASKLGPGDRQDVFNRLTGEAAKFRSELRPELLKWLPDRFGTSVFF